MLAKEVEQATKYASGSASEFLNEADTVLHKILSVDTCILTDAERADLISIINQIRIAFNKVGGA